MDKAVIDGIGNVILWLCLAVPAIWIPFRAMAKGPEKKNKDQSEDDRYEDDSLREEQARLERIDRHIINQEQI